MDTDRFLALLRSDADRMLAIPAADPSVLDQDVPCCPGWTVRDVLLHTAEVYLNKVACMRLQREPDPWPPEGWPPEDAVPAFRGALDELVRELESREPGDPSFTWYPPDQTVGFWYRRMAQETAVHRVDVESAVDAATPVDHDLALDGIDEVLTIFLPYDWSEVPEKHWGGVDLRANVGRSVCIRCADHAWHVTLQSGNAAVRTQPGEADATVTGEPSELLLWLWGRRPLSAVHAEGDDSAVAAFRERMVLATQ